MRNRDRRLADASNVTPLVDVGVVAISIGGVVASVITIAITYTLCVKEGVCPAFLPFISDTWVSPPGSYISRIVVGLIAPLLATVQIALWVGFGWTTASPRPPDKTRSSVSKPYIQSYHRLVLALVACFSLSVLSAVCENNFAPGCQGGIVIHGTCALIFFFGYSYVCIDYGMQLISSIKGNLKTLRRSAMVALLLLSVLLKLRYFVRAPGEQSLIPLQLRGRLGKMLTTVMEDEDGFPPIAQIAEWTDTGILLICTIIFSIAEAGNLSVAIVQIKGGNADPTSEALLPSSFSPTYFFVPANVIWAAAVSLYFFAAIAALLTTVVLGRVAIWPWPELSAIWAAKPGNLFSRWSLVQGGALFAISQVCLFFITDPAFDNRSSPSSSFYIESKLARQIGLTLSLFATLCLAIVGCIDDNENETDHNVASAAAYGLYTLYILVILIFGSSSVSSKLPSSPSLATMPAWVGVSALTFSALTLSALSAACHTFKGWMVASLQVPPVLLSFLEWASYILFISFPAVLYYSSGDVKESIGVSLVSTSSQSRGRQMEEYNAIVDPVQKITRPKSAEPV